MSSKLALADSRRKNARTTIRPCRLREAELLKRKKDYAAARERLESSAWQSADAETQEAAAYLLCDLCDRLDDPDAAFGYAVEANRICAAGLSAQRTDRGAYFRLIDELSEVFALEERVAKWPECNIDDDSPDPVFLVGFPRSGTTLLNTILLSHTDISATEEEPTVFALESAMREMTGALTEPSFGSGRGSRSSRCVRSILTNSISTWMPGTGQSGSSTNCL